MKDRSKFADTTRYYNGPRDISMLNVHTIIMMIEKIKRKVSEIFLIK